MPLQTIPGFTVANGFYQQWNVSPIGSLQWIAVLSETDGSFIFTQIVNQRSSFRFNVPGGGIPADAQILQLRMKGWMQWPGNVLGGGSTVNPFYRLGTTDVEGFGSWSVNADPEDPAAAGPIEEKTSIITSLAPSQLLIPDFGVRFVSGRRTRIHALKLEIDVRPYSDRATMAGHRGWTRRRAV